MRMCGGKMHLRCTHAHHPCGVSRSEEHARPERSEGARRARATFSTDMLLYKTTFLQHPCQKGKKVEKGG